MFLMSQIIIFFTLMFYVMSHPMVLNFIIILLGGFMSYLIFLMNSSAWFCYLLVMVFLSSMMIMFMYMASLVSNENMKKSKLSLFYTLVLFMLGPSLILMNSRFLTMEKPFLSKHCLTKNNNVMEMIYKSYNVVSMEMTLFLISYLLLVLIVAVKVASTKSTPLRVK